MPMIVSPRLRYWRSYATSDGTERVQLPHVNTQKLSSTTRPRSSASRSGWSVLSQLVFVSSGAGDPPPLGTGGRSAAVVPATTPASNSTPIEEFRMFLPQVSVRVGAWRTTPLRLSMIVESRESSRTSRKARDRAERREVPVRRAAECVDRLAPAGLQHVQVAAVVAPRDVVDARADQGGPAVGIHQTDRAVRHDGKGRHRSSPVAGEAEAAVRGHDGPARRALVR